MFFFFFSCVKVFGFLQGLRTYFQIKILGSSSITIPGLKSAITIRRGTGDINTFREIFLRKEYDIKLPPTINPKVIIDAGANIGFTTLFFSIHFPGAAILSLEPDSGNFALLSQNTKHNPLITPIKTALYNKEGNIYLQDNGYGVRGYMVTDAPTPTTIIELPATTLPLLISKYNLQRIDILKMDIEGSEREVFEHATETWLPKTACLIVELHDRMKPGCSKAVFTALSKYNFSCEIKGENFVFINEDLI